MTTIIGISGSLRRGSFNTSLLKTAATLMPEGAELKIESIHDIPLYNGDLELEGIPQRVTQTVFDETGRMTDETIRKQLEQFLRGFVGFIVG